VSSSFAVTRYVALNGGNVAPYTNWAMAATSLQTGVDAAVDDDEVVVSNGVYNTGYRNVGTTRNRLVIASNITVRSLSGYKQTVIEGQGPLGDAAVRCVYMYKGTLDGFTITNGYTKAAGATEEYCGGGVNGQYGTATVRNCYFIMNKAAWAGGAVFGSDRYGCLMLCYNCLFVTNEASHGAAANVSTLKNCTLVNNVGNAVQQCSVENSIVYFNTTAQDISTFRYSCVTPQQSGTGNITNEPQFVSAAAGDWRLLSTSPCFNAGSNMPWMVGANDLDGNPRILYGRVDMGALEYVAVELVVTSAPCTVAHAVTSTTVAGTNSGCVGTLWASNAANNLVYPFPAADGWVSPEIALEVGANAIDVSGTNTFGVLAQDSVVLTRKAATPTGVAASDGTFTGKVALAWLAAPGAVSYRILRAETNDSASAATIATAVSNTVYDDTSATPGLLYYYWVIAQQNGVEGDPSAPDSGYRQLAASSSIAATLGYYTNNVVVSWAAVEGATKYRVYRADSALTNIADLIGSDIADTNYTDSTATPGLVYYYWVQAQSAVAASAWSATTPGYALLAANFLDKKTWSMRDTKKMDTLTCKQLPGPWSALFNSSWRVAIVNASTHEIVSGPFELVTKNGKKYTYKSALATITYTQNYNKRKDTYKCKLIFKFAGAMPTQPGVFLQQPVAGVSVRQ
jgi:hypothetical protein